MVGRRAVGERLADIDARDRLLAVREEGSFCETVADPRGAAAVGGDGTAHHIRHHSPRMIPLPGLAVMEDG